MYGKELPTFDRIRPFGGGRRISGSASTSAFFRGKLSLTRQRALDTPPRTERRCFALHGCQ